MVQILCFPQSPALVAVVAEQGRLLQKTVARVEE